MDSWMMREFAREDLERRFRQDRGPLAEGHSKNRRATHGLWVLDVALELGVLILSVALLATVFAMPLVWWFVPSVREHELGVFLFAISGWGVLGWITTAFMLTSIAFGIAIRAALGFAWGVQWCIGVAVCGLLAVNSPLVAGACLLMIGVCGIISVLLSRPASLADWLERPTFVVAAIELLRRGCNLLRAGWRLWLAKFRVLSRGRGITD